MLRNLSIRASLVWGMGCLSAIMLVLGCLGLGSLRGSNDELRAMYAERLLPMQYLSQVVAALEHSRSGIAAAILNPADVEADMRALERSLAEGQAAWQRYDAAIVTDRERQLALQFSQRYALLVRQGVTPAMEAIRAFNVPGATELYTQTLSPLHAQAVMPMAQLMSLQREQGQVIYEHSQHRYRLLFAAYLGAAGLGLVLAAVMGALLVRALSRPLAAAVTVAQGVAAGDLTQVIAPAGNNETGRLIQALRTMNENLAGIVLKVHLGTQAISGASVEIAQGNRDLSQRTERQAASLEETATAMETLTRSVSCNADQAREASQMAQQAAGVAAQAGAVVEQVTQTMQAIDSASRNIVEIIAVIDSIAFQTNILALNAAVEAARAGEQGRGFAVVATEVRALAQHSASAARQIKVLISNSVDKVDVGSRLAQTAGSTMRQVIDSIDRVSQVVTGIADASDDQRHGIGQINAVIVQIDTSTQQNAALVEQAAASAQALRHQAHELELAVGAFRVARLAPPAHTSDDPAPLPLGHR
ncbi:methyl-accepting chemotaxis protein [Herbaspirillum sp. YR522]|uniref:methyl-accepting chemotaxis protein n=1 Tax=Herbaspirillum sp. YR522 TaxID=1144342 RepID=UPI00026FBC19|nr:methyl-accepting chemotaxis protein [Herbaspirillum sp. YR522]EJN07755.1 methyl-accepting chemotaxis protein [Herbaspirillum sp. YR522]